MRIFQSAKASGASKKGAANVLSAAAPLLMNLLGKETESQQQSGSSSGGSGQNAAVSAIMGALLKNADLGSILTGLLGGSSGKDEKEDKKDENNPDGLLGVPGSLLGGK